MRMMMMMMMIARGMELSILMSTSPMPYVWPYVHRTRTDHHQYKTLRRSGDSIH